MATGHRAHSRRSARSVLALCAAAALSSSCGADLTPQLGLDLPADAAVPQILRVLTYNVAGLPEALVPSHAARNNALIGPLLNDYDLVLLQEDFAYHSAILASSSHLHASLPDPSARALGDGLTMLATAPFTDFQRIAWKDCFGVMDSGSDCLTAKGFTFARLTVGTLGTVDVYNVHTDAGYTSGDLDARRKNLQQLTDAILTFSADEALIVVGDFNERFHNNLGNLRAFGSVAGLRDAWQADTLPSTEADWTCAEGLSGDSLELDDPACERLDKIFYRSTDVLTLAPIDYRVEGTRFIDEEGRQLSDHRPVSVAFAISSTHAGNSKID